jgi:pimeloyl-ACP methyl ester carboxylesterase
MAALTQNLTSDVSSALPLSTQTWNWRGHTIAYTVQGIGQPLMLVHGFGASIGHWRNNIPVWATAGYQVFAIDLLGFGASDKPPLAYSLELWESMLLDFWQTHIQAPTIWIGNSIGGLLCQMMLANHPETSAGGVLINSAGGLNHRPDELNWPLRLVMRAFIQFVSHPITGTFLFNQVRQKHRIRSTLKQVYRNPAAITDELVELLYRPSCDPGAQKVFASILTASPGPSPDQLLPEIHQPLLVLWGEADPWTPITGAKIYQDYQQQGYPITVQPIANAGHCPHDEYPDLVNEAVISWLRSQP